jgi:hypothetical protein
MPERASSLPKGPWLVVLFGLDEGPEELGIRGVRWPYRVHGTNEGPLAGEGDHDVLDNECS